MKKRIIQVSSIAAALLTLFVLVNALSCQANAGKFTIDSNGITVNKPKSFVKENVWFDDNDNVTYVTGLFTNQSFYLNSKETLDELSVALFTRTLEIDYEAYYMSEPNGVYDGLAELKIEEMPNDAYHITELAYVHSANILTVSLCSASGTDFVRISYAYDESYNNIIGAVIIIV